MPIFEIEINGEITCRQKEFVSVAAPDRQAAEDILNGQIENGRHLNKMDSSAYDIDVQGWSLRIIAERPDPDPNQFDLPLTS